MSRVARDRLLLGEAAVVTVAEAARRLGWRGAACWIREQGLVRYPGGVERVVWGDVVEAVRSCGTTTLRRREGPTVPIKFASEL